MLAAMKRTQHIVHPADILLPCEDAAHQTWPVVACDQFTSEPEYWEALYREIGDRPSTLKLILPEVYLGAPDEDAREREILQNMNSYLSGNVLCAHPSSYVYVERRTPWVTRRRGLVAAVDLERYDFDPGSAAPVRASEGTIVERLPPRVRIRKQAALELPHILVLYDEPEDRLMRYLESEARHMQPGYDIDLIGEGGHLTGYVLPAGEGASPAESERAARIEAELSYIADPERLASLYGVENAMAYAMGDGNHSLATAKAVWDELAPTLSEAERENHPARFALVELLNVHDPGLPFEPIHRLVWKLDPSAFSTGLRDFLATRGRDRGGMSDTETITLISEGRQQQLALPAGDELAISHVQDYLDSLGDIGVDYIHGDEALTRLASREGYSGVLLPAINKAQLFPTVLQRGVLPRKAFSLGHAREKRYYMEARAIR